MRAGEINQFLRFVGIGRAKDEQNGVQSYVQRTLLVYIGWRIFEDNPIGGAGWQASTEQRVYGRTCRPPTASSRDAGARLPLARAPLGRPERVRPGHVRPGRGRAARVPLAARQRRRHPRPAGPARAARGRRRALVAVVWLVLVMGVLSALGLVAGIPTDALLWLTLGFCVLAAGGKELVRAR